MKGLKVIFIKQNISLMLGDNNYKKEKNLLLN